MTWPTTRRAAAVPRGVSRGYGEARSRAKEPCLEDETERITQSRDESEEVEGVNVECDPTQQALRGGSGGGGLRL